MKTVCVNDNPLKQGVVVKVRENESEVHIKQHKWCGSLKVK